MKADDLARAAKVYAELRSLRAVNSRVADGEVLAVTVGSGAAQASIKLTPDTQQKLGAKILADLKIAIGTLTEELENMGVQP